MTDLTGDLRTTYEPILEKIAAGALQRELDGDLPFEPVRWLKDVGIGAVRLSREYGGLGIGLPELTRLWIALAAADNNLAQALRGHVAFAEDRLWQHARGRDQRAWFDRFVAGEIAGKAWSEVGSTAIDTQRTVLAGSVAEGWRLTGTKFYTTGSIFAEWADVSARRERAGHDDDCVVAVVDTRAPGVSVIDDWNGFGRRGTGSGTATFADVAVPDEHVLPFGERFPYQAALHQLNLLATLTGIGRAALADTVAAVRARERDYSHASAARVRDDPQVLARVGETSVAVYAAEATTLRVAAALQEVADAATSVESLIARLVEQAEVETAAAQVVVSDLVLRATTDLFDTLGGSAASRTAGLDRHWCNARTVASHNPQILKSRVVGGWLVNHTPPPYAWASGPPSGTRPR